MKKVLYISLAVKLFIMLIVITIPTMPAFAENKPMGMVLEITGRAKIKQNNILSPANIMQPIYENSIIYTGKDSSLKFADYRDKQEYLVGNYSYIIFKYGKVEIKRGSLHKIAGGRKLPLPQNTVLVSRKISGKVYMYVRELDIKIISPDDKTVFASNDIEFTWNGDDMKEYEIILIEAGTDRILKPYPVTVKDMRYKYSPAAGSPFRLEYGKSYYFVVREKARKDLIEKYGRDEIFTDQARIAFSLLPEAQAKKVQEGEKEYKKAIGKNPDDRTAMLLMADLYKENGMYRQAVNILYALQEREPCNPYVHYFIADMLDKLKLPGSEKMREQGIKLEKGLQGN